MGATPLGRIAKALAFITGNIIADIIKRGDGHPSRLHEPIGAPIVAGQLQLLTDAR